MKEEFEQFKKEQNKRMKKYFVIIIITAIVLGITSGVGAYQMSAREINFTPSDNTWKVNNVSDAIDDLKFKKVSNNYSTEEQVVGTWIDGKPIYQMTVYAAGPFTLTTTSGNVDMADLSSYNIKSVISPVTGVALSWTTSGNTIMQTIPLSVINTVWSDFLVQDNHLYFRGSRNSGSTVVRDVYATIQYTKTTDTATN